MIHTLRPKAFLFLFSIFISFLYSANQDERVVINAHFSNKCSHGSLKDVREFLHHYYGNHPFTFSLLPKNYWPTPSPLHRACIRQDCAIVQLLLEHGMFPDGEHYDELLRTLKVCLQNEIERRKNLATTHALLTVLLNKGADRSRTELSQAIVEACQNNGYRVLEKSHFWIGTHDDIKQHITLRKLLNNEYFLDNPEATCFLINLMKDKDTVFTTTIPTIFEIILTQHSAPVLEAFLNAGANPTSPFPMSGIIPEMFRQSNRQSTSLSDCRTTGLVIQNPYFQTTPWNNKQKKKAKLLLSCQARDKAGNTLLHLICQKKDYLHEQDSCKQYRLDQQKKWVALACSHRSPALKPQPQA